MNAPIYDALLAERRPRPSWETFPLGEARPSRWPWWLLGAAFLALVLFVVVTA